MLIQQQPTSWLAADKREAGLPQHPDRWRERGVGRGRDRCHLRMGECPGKQGSDRLRRVASALVLC